MAGTYDRRIPDAEVNEEKYRQWYDLSVRDPELFWNDQAKALIDWFSPWKKILDFDYKKGFISWFEGATTNVCHNCVDRHLAKRGNKTAIIWEQNEPGQEVRISYKELHAMVCRAANVLKALGVKKGDTVALYLPMHPMLAAFMLACARIGAVHSVVFAGFSAESLRSRLIDAQSQIVITANEGLRGPKGIPLKSTVDDAVKDLPFIRKVLVLKRTAASCAMKPGRDEWIETLWSKVSDSCPIEPVDAEHPLFILYTSGSTGKPKGVLHTHGGYILYATMTHRYVFDIRENDTYFCAADCGWITGHSYIVYGPLSNGSTTVMFEATPLYPDAGRYWETVERLKANIFYTAPTAIRSVAREDQGNVNSHDLSSLRVIGTVGEPINLDAWEWYFQNVGKEKCPVVDTWWQTETGGICITPLPGATILKPCYASTPFFGIRPVLVDDEGKVIEKEEATGRLCIAFPWPGQMRGVYNDPDRFRETYFSQFPGMYFTGDSCTRDADNYHRITGRVDDVVNVSGHRLGTAEVESAIAHSGKVVEAAVIGVPHPVKGEGLCAFCITYEGISTGEDTLRAVQDAVRHQLGGFAVPDRIVFVPGLPKTRSGKIMRRILRALATGNESGVGDITTLAEPGVVDAIRGVLAR